MQCNLIIDNKDECMLNYDLQKVLLKTFEESDIPFTIFHVDNNFLPVAFIDVNKAFCGLLGYEREELLSMDLVRVYGDPIGKTSEFGDIDNLGGNLKKSYILRQYLIGKEGDKIPVEMHQYSTDISGIGICASVILDISEQMSCQVKKDKNTEYCGSIIEVTEKKQIQDTIRFMAYHDSMTGLCNLTHFYDKLENYIEKNRLKNTTAAVLYLDVDGFKSVNDSLGHTIGDKVINIISERLKSLLNKKHIIARGFGDEFLILMKDTNKEQVNFYVSKILNGFRKPFLIDNYEFYLTMSIGVSYYPENGQEAKLLVKNSKTAMYNVKENGYDGVKAYDITLKEKVDNRGRIRNELRRALEKEEFLIHYQPKVDIKSLEVIGAEALIRWNYQGNSIIAPNEFIPIAEETRLIIPIGNWVINNVCMDNIEWRNRGLIPLRIAVNISAVQLQNKNFLSSVKQILQKTKLDPKYLEFEITESALINNFISSNEVLNELRGIGISITLDDFGTGYSSLNYLRNLNIDNLKIDRSFIQDIVKDQKNRDIVKGIIEMAHALGIAVTAEGVEEMEQLEILRRYNCDYMQGYLFCKPLPSIDYENIVRRGIYDISTCCS